MAKNVRYQKANKSKGTVECGFVGNDLLFMEEMTKILNALPADVFKAAMEKVGAYTQGGVINIDKVA